MELIYQIPTRSEYLTFETDKGCNDYHSASLACAKAKELFMTIVLAFNGFDIEVRPESCPQDIVYIYNLLCRIRQLEKR